MIIGIGTDILKKSRIKNLLQPHTHQSQNLLKFPKKILSSEEFDIYNKLTEFDKKADYLAVRWSCKESLYKALYPLYKPTWKEVSILKNQEKPFIRWQTDRFEVEKGLEYHLSVSHDGDFVVSYVIVEKRAN
ncbi:4'-phosphopantetheinyl transferase [Conidiobolus coronatus NRRL 28638]|uniref:4'-phosphopantetheinyl transferase n=1 Tax=Conidiobolus coronatus (strain ATCC 28846 / CBS 209.66 / NRRL 28638) TaxID=796925 RepID=A0A137P6V6_CONC2|nr:4'-phosphopantetheinyl transferase [Conidiobolus coronatus NRRL 28638]|eukprot:KXN70728.1 4'-phosphopantetheinyl transferase [Conidiobolus coronatus NRRL 28638]